MAAGASNRIWASLTSEEAVEVAQAAEARGMRPSELVRVGVLSFIRQASPGAAVDAVPAGLEALIETLGRHVNVIGQAVPSLEDARAEREAVRGSLRDIAQAVGTLAGSIAPPEDASAGAGPF